MTRYRCPTDGNPVTDVIGCGAVFEQSEPDHEGLVDCICGMWFRPRSQDIVSDDTPLTPDPLGETA